MQLPQPAHRMAAWLAASVWPVWSCGSKEPSKAEGPKAQDGAAGLEAENDSKGNVLALLESRFIGVLRLNPTVPVPTQLLHVLYQDIVSFALARGSQRWTMTRTWLWSWSLCADNFYILYCLYFFVGVDESWRVFIHEHAKEFFVPLSRLHSRVRRRKQKWRRNGTRTRRPGVAVADRLLQLVLVPVRPLDCRRQGLQKELDCTLSLCRIWKLRKIRSRRMKMMQRPAYAAKRYVSEEAWWTPKRRWRTPKWRPKIVGHEAWTFMECSKNVTNYVRLCSTQRQMLRGTKQKLQKCDTRNWGLEEHVMWPSPDKAGVQEDVVKPHAIEDEEGAPVINVPLTQWKDGNVWRVGCGSRVDWSAHGPWRRDGTCHWFPGIPWHYLDDNWI